VGTTEIHYANSVHGIATHRDVFINVLRDVATMDFMREVRRVMRHHSPAWKGETRSVTVVESTNVAAVSDEVRAETVAVTKEFTSLAAVVVIEGSGFAAAMVRTLIAGIYAVQRQPYPYKIAGTVPEGARWLLDKTADRARAAVSASELIAAVETARRALGAQSQGGRSA
jgi:hypothetical protein